MDLDRRGNRWLGLGGALGVAGGVVVVALPVTLIELSRYAPGGLQAASTDLVQWTSWAVLAGAVLLFLCFFAYRWGYSVLRKVDHRYWLASGLCLVGSTGVVLLVVAAAAVLAGNTSGVLSCLRGSYGAAYGCIQNATPLGAYAGVAGVWLAWVGSIGIVVGLFQAGSRYLSGLYTAAAVCYLLTLVALVGPLAGLFVSVPYTEYLLLLAPVLAILAPALVLAARPTYPGPRSAREAGVART